MERIKNIEKKKVIDRLGSWKGELRFPDTLKSLGWTPSDSFSSKGFISLAI